MYGKLEDKFGDNGVVSVVIGRIEDGAQKVLHIDLWIMSCRVLKRDMEYAMMDRLAEECAKAGITVIMVIIILLRRIIWCAIFMNYRAS